MRISFTLVVALLVSGCGHVPLTSLPKLSRMDMMTLDAEQLRVAVDMPDGLRVQEDSAIIVAGLKESPAGSALEERFVLEEVETGVAAGNLPAGAQVFRIAESDLQRLEALRAVVRERKRNFPRDTRGFLTVTSSGCRRGALPDGPLYVDTLLRTTDSEDYFVLTNDVDLRKLAPIAQLESKLPPCRRAADG